MLLSYLWTFMAALSLAAALCTGTGSTVSAAAMEGAEAGVELSIAMAGGLCLWMGLSRVMEKSGITGLLQKLLRPLLGRIFPKTREDPAAFGSLCGNFTANLLGLGNAATPLGIHAVCRMSPGTGEATDEMCRLIVLNTASVQLIPTTVAAARAALGAPQPFDILPAVWLASLCSAAAGTAAAWLMGKCHG